MSGKKWSDSEIKYLQTNYHKIPVTNIAQQLNRSYQSVQRKAKNLQLTQPVSNQTPWTEKELMILEKYYCSYGPKRLAKRLHRTEYSVKRKAQSQNLRVYECEYISLKTLTRCFHVESRKIHQWINKFELPMKSQKHGTQTFYIINTDDFWVWAYNHQDVIPFEKYERQSLLPEPTWLKQKYRFHTIQK